MLIHRDTQSSQAANDDSSRGAEFLSVSTFLKPHFRICVVPSSGELEVQVELRSPDTRIRRSAHH